MNERKISKAVANRLRVDCYDDVDSPGLEAGDFYLHERAKDVALYRNTSGQGRYRDQLVGRFIPMRRSLFHLELNADFLSMVNHFSLFDRSGLPLQFRHGMTFVRAVTLEDVPAVIELIVAAVELDLIRHKVR